METNPFKQIKPISTTAPSSGGLHIDSLNLYVKTTSGPIKCTTLVATYSDTSGHEELDLYGIHSVLMVTRTHSTSRLVGTDPEPHTDAGPVYSLSKDNNAPCSASISTGFSNTMSAPEVVK